MSEYFRDSENFELINLRLLKELNDSITNRKTQVKNEQRFLSSLPTVQGHSLKRSSCKTFFGQLMPLDFESFFELDPHVLHNLD